jgi:hypothetical protein
MYADAPVPADHVKVADEPVSTEVGAGLVNAAMVCARLSSGSKKHHASIRRLKRAT